MDRPRFLRSRLLLDFWNIQSGWNDAVKTTWVQGVDPKLDWAAFPKLVLTAAAQALRATDGFRDDTVLDTRPGAFTKRMFVGLHPDASRTFYTKTLVEQGGYEPPFIRTNPRRDLDVECRSCKQEIRDCTGCGQRLVHYPEKGVDVALSTDMLLHATKALPEGQTAADVVLLCSGDTDFVPAVQAAQHLGLPVVVASWNRQANELFQVADAVVLLDEHIKRLQWHPKHRGR